MDTHTGHSRGNKNHTHRHRSSLVDLLPQPWRRARRRVCILYTYVYARVARFYRTQTNIICVAGACLICASRILMAWLCACGFVGFFCVTCFTLVKVRQNFVSMCIQMTTTAGSTERPARHTIDGRRRRRGRRRRASTTRGHHIRAQHAQPSPPNLHRAAHTLNVDKRPHAYAHAIVQLSWSHHHTSPSRNRAE